MLRKRSLENWAGTWRKSAKDWQDAAEKTLKEEGPGEDENVVRGRLLWARAQLELLEDLKETFGLKLRPPKKKS